MNASEEADADSRKESNQRASGYDLTIYDSRWRELTVFFPS